MYSRVSINGASLTVIPWRYRPPVGRERSHGARVQHAETKQMVELESDAIHCPVETSLQQSLKYKR